jgi:hypothetical protein
VSRRPVDGRPVSVGGQTGLDRVVSGIPDGPAQRPGLPDVRPSGLANPRFLVEIDAVAVV